VLEAVSEVCSGGRLTAIFFAPVFKNHRHATHDLCDF
jgi:hypothetical protein